MKNNKIQVLKKNRVINFSIAINIARNTIYFEEYKEFSVTKINYVENTFEGYTSEERLKKPEERTISTFDIGVISKFGLFL
jgi:hypothetical protein